MSSVSLVAIEPAKGDDTVRLQAAIDGLSASGGGRVELTAGIHVCRGSSSNPASTFIWPPARSSVPFRIMPPTRIRVFR